MKATIYCSNDVDTKISLEKTVDMPYIDSESYAWMKRNLRGDNIEVHAGCDVYIVKYKTWIEGIIHRFD